MISAPSSSRESAQGEPSRLPHPGDVVAESAAVQLVILDDHQIFSASLARLLDDDAEIQVAGISSSIAELPSTLGAHSPDVVVIDWQLADGDGADAISLVRDACPDANVLILTGNLDDATLRRAVAAGSDGFVTKDRGPDDLVAAIRAVGRGEVAYEASALARVIGNTGPDATTPPDISEREVDVITLLADGCSNKQIAERLYLSPNTVRNHIHRISGKLDASSRLEVVVEAARLGIIQLPA